MCAHASHALPPSNVTIFSFMDSQVHCKLLLPPQQPASESCAAEALVSAPVSSRRTLEAILRHPCSMKQEELRDSSGDSGKVSVPGFPFAFICIIQMFSYDYSHCIILYCL